MRFQEATDAEPLSQIRVDCHCHILPGLDDGAQTLEEAVFLAGKLVEFGYGRAICTSHSSFSFRNTPDTVLPACDLLREELSRVGVPLELVPSMEYRLIPQTWPIVRENGWLLPWEGNHLLIELPIREPFRVGDIVPADEMKKLLDEGYQPVLAHPERYLYMNEEDYRRLKELGVCFQRNLGSKEGFYGEAVRERAQMLDANGMYEFVGSDLHDKNYARFFEQYVF